MKSTYYKKINKNQRPFQLIVDKKSIIIVNQQ